MRTCRAAPLLEGMPTARIFSPRTGTLLSRVGHLPPADVRLPLLSPALARRFVRLDAAAAARAFVARHPPFGPLGRAAYALARLAGTPMFFGVHHMQLFDAASARAVLAAGGARLAPGGAPPAGALVDVGAGPGCVTAPLAALFRCTVATEASAPCCALLARRGFAVVRGDGLGPAVAPAVRAALGGAAAGAAGAPPPPPPRVVAALNVLDRCARPRALLRQLVELATDRRAGRPRALREHGRVLLALRLPLDSYVLAPSGRVVAQAEPPLVAPVDEPDDERGERDPADGAFALTRRWERELEALVATLERDAALRVEAFTRLPYLCQGEHPRSTPFYALDDCVLVCRPVDEDGGVDEQ